MFNLELEDIADLVKYKRKKSGIKIADLEDDQLSKSTISKIENSEYKEVTEKTIYLLSKLGITTENIYQIQKEKNEYDIQLTEDTCWMMKMVDLLPPDSFRERMRQWTMKKDDFRYPAYCYLRGKLYFKTNFIEKAKKSFWLAIEKDENKLKMNVPSLAYTELGRIEYYSNDIDKALELNSLAIEKIDDRGQNLWVKDIAQVNQVIYLEKLDRREEAAELISNLCKRINEIESVDVKIQIHLVKSRLLRKSYLLEEAKEVAWKGIELAELNRNYDRACSLLIELGEICYLKNQIERSEQCYLAALDMRDLLSKGFILIEVYKNLGGLYISSKQYTKAKQVLHEALDLGKRHNDSIRYLEALIMMAHFFKEQDDIKLAILHYDLALTEAEKHNHISYQPDILFELVGLYEQIDQQKYLTYLQKHHHALKKAKSSKGV